jgi:hypothetical protein
MSDKVLLYFAWIHQQSLTRHSISISHMTVAKISRKWNFNDSQSLERAWKQATSMQKKKKTKRISFKVVVISSQFNLKFILWLKTISSAWSDEKRGTEMKFISRSLFKIFRTFFEFIMIDNHFTFHWFMIWLPDLKFIHRVAFESCLHYEWRLICTEPFKKSH